MTLPGAGFARAEGAAVFVTGAVTGDTARVRIVKMEKRFARGEIIELLTPSEHRITPLCPYFGECGGCAFCHVDYDYELEIKRRGVEAAFRRAGFKNVSAADIISASPMHYRRKAVFHFDADGKCGFFAGASNRVIDDFHSCLICQDIFDEIRERYCALLREENAAGEAKYIMLRTGEYGECAVVVGISGESARTAALRLAEERKEIVSLSVGSGDSPDSDVPKLIYGKGAVTERMCELDFDVAPGAFFQVNPPVAGRLIETVSRMISPPAGSRIADLYCGTGAIGLSLAAMNPGICVTGIEINASAVECAKMNAARGGILNCRFFCGDSSICPDVIDGDIYAAVIDPPRSGASEKMLRGLMGLSPRKIAYVSCNPATLARDTTILAKGGYALREVHAADMFPRCAHVESAALFEKI